MDFRSFMVGGFDGEFHFEPEGGFADGEGNSPLNRFVNNEALVIDVAPMNIAPLSPIAENVKDLDDVSLRGDIVGEVKRLHKSLKVTGKRKQATSPSVKEAHHKLRKAPPQASKVASDAYDPLDVDSDSGIHEFPSSKELKDSADCCFVVAHTVLNNMLNSRTHQLMSALKKARALCDAIREKEIKKDKACAELERKLDLCLKRKNGLTISRPCPCFAPKLKDLNLRERLKNSKTQLIEDIDSLKQDWAIVVSKVVYDVAMKLIRSDEMGFLIAKLVKVAMLRGRCAAFEEVASLKEPFILENLSGYRYSSKKEFDHAGDGLANASYPYLNEVTNNTYAIIEKLLSKKPQSLCSKPALSCSMTSSLKAPVM
nr:hypothetical protein [Tanacetum cinerariifolium]